MDFLFTTGDTVTFKFSRGELENDFDIRITITPVACMYSNRDILVLIVLIY